MNQTRNTKMWTTYWKFVFSNFIIAKPPHPFGSLPPGCFHRSYTECFENPTFLNSWREKLSLYSNYFQFSRFHFNWNFIRVVDKYLEIQIPGRWASVGLFLTRRRREYDEGRRLYALFVLANVRKEKKKTDDFYLFVTLLLLANYTTTGDLSGCQKFRLFA